MDVKKPITCSLGHSTNIDGGLLLGSSARVKRRIRNEASIVVLPDIGNVQSDNLGVVDGVRTIRKSHLFMHQSILIKKLNLSWV